MFLLYDILPLGSSRVFVCLGWFSFGGKNLASKVLSKSNNVRFFFDFFTFWNQQETVLHQGLHVGVAFCLEGISSLSRLSHRIRGFKKICFSMIRNNQPFKSQRQCEVNFGDLNLKNPEKNTKL